jgi:acetoin utilization deacetylase AcuC-like enzyme
VKLIYSDGYDLNIGEHVFPCAKYKMSRDRALSNGWASPVDILEPELASDTDILRVHRRDYVDRLQAGTLSAREIAQLELPYSPQLVRGFWLAAGGSILAARHALLDGAAVNVGGGFHHAFPEHGEGFCAVHDVAVAIRALQAEGLIKTAMTVDLDVHQGNGTAAIFHDDATVFTFSMHQENNYPFVKPPSDLDIGLDDGCGDAEYLQYLRDGLKVCFSRLTPDLIFYVAGADPYRDDQLGGLALTLEGLLERDRMVFAAARERGIPIAVGFAGGYARKLEDTVTIHVNTIRTAVESLAAQRSSPARKTG